MNKKTVSLILIIFIGVAVFMLFTQKNVKNTVLEKGSEVVSKLIIRDEETTGAGRLTIDSVMGDPVQRPAEGEVTTTAAGYNITIRYLASYDIKALVVHTKSYPGVSYASVLSPCDLALAWGNVAKYNDEVNLNWSQSGRWYSWRADSSSEIEQMGGTDGVNKHSANCHIVPATDTVKKVVKNLKEGDIVELKGYLVDIQGTKGDGTSVSWTSSTSRDDTGDGACELIYVTDIIVN